MACRRFSAAAARRSRLMATPLAITPHSPRKKACPTPPSSTSTGNPKAEPPPAPPLPPGKGLPPPAPLAASLAVAPVGSFAFAPSWRHHTLLAQSLPAAAPSCSRAPPATALQHETEAQVRDCLTHKFFLHFFSRTKPPKITKNFNLNPPSV
jgi:hypothetical protein